MHVLGDTFLFFSLLNKHKLCMSGRGSPSGRTGLWWQPPSGFDFLSMRKLPCLFWTLKRYWVRSSPGKALPGEVNRCLTGPRGMTREMGNPWIKKKKNNNKHKLWINGFSDKLSLTTWAVQLCKRTYVKSTTFYIPIDSQNGISRVICFCLKMINQNGIRQTLNIQIIHHEYIKWKETKMILDKRIYPFVHPLLLKKHSALSF